MLLSFSISDLSWTQIAIFGGGAIVLIIIIAIFANKGKYAARYRNFYKKIDKAITKKYNGNLLIETVINSLVTDQTNTFKSLKSKGRRKVSQYFEYYTKNLPELVLYKSFIASDKNKNELVILFLDDRDKVLLSWDKRKKVKGLIKACNKYQMLTPLIGFLYELPLHIHENASFRLTNHENDTSLSYDIVKNPKKIKRKQKPVKLTKTEMKAQAKVDKIKAKKNQKTRR